MLHTIGVLHSPVSNISADYRQLLYLIVSQRNVWEVFPETCIENFYGKYLEV
jgi:hypothetical protein